MKAKIRTTHVRVSPTVAREWLVANLPAEQAESLLQRQSSADALTRELNRADVRYNRRVSEHHWKKLARDMSTPGRWIYDGQPIRRDVNGRLRDGQHRCLAVIYTGKTIEFLVVDNLDPESYFTMDMGRARKVGDQLTDVRNVTNVVSITSLLLRWRNGQLLSGEGTPTALEVREFIEKTPEIQNAVKDAQRVRKALPKATISVLGAVWLEANQLDENKCAELFELLVTGAIAEERHPILTLRNIINRYDATLNNKYRQWQKLWHAARAWNAWRDDQMLKSLITPITLTSSKFPRMK